MKRVSKAAMLAATLALAYSHSTVAIAQGSPDLRNPRITFDYFEPRNQDMLRLYQRMQQRKVLEELSQFLAPVNWPKRLRMTMKECPAGTPVPQVFYSKIEYSLNICYQWLAFLNALKPAPADATKQQAVVGGLVGSVLNASAHAVFDMMQIPRLGSEEDAADQIAAYVGLQFGDQVAQAVTRGTYVVLKTFDLEITDKKRQYDFANKLSTPRQRMINVLCIAYGAPSSPFKAFVDQGDLLAGRAEGCAEEYRQVQHAFDKTIKPKVNGELMKKVLSVTWIDAADLK